MPQNLRYEFKHNIDYLLNPSQEEMEMKNFDHIPEEATGDMALLNFIASVKGLRKKVEKMGSEASSLSKNINAMRRISYITELDYKFCAAVNC